MAGAEVAVDFRALVRIQREMERLGLDLNMEEALGEVAAEVEFQTRERIESGENVGPDGIEWPPWSERYAATRHGGHNLLRNDGHLLESLTYLVRGEDAVVGTNLEYGATHQFGDEDRNIPARPYLGLSDENVDDIEHVLEVYLEGLFEDMARRAA